MRQRSGRFWPVVARLWRVVTKISDRIGIGWSIGGGLAAIVIGFVLPGLFAGSLLSLLIGYLLGVLVSLFGFMLFMRGVI